MMSAVFFFLPLVMNKNEVKFLYLFGLLTNNKVTCLVNFKQSIVNFFMKSEWISVNLREKEQVSKIDVLSEQKKIQCKSRLSLTLNKLFILFYLERA